MPRANKIINAPDAVVTELLDGFVLASHGRIRRIGNTGGLVRTEIPDGKVALLIGGGSGHEPLFPGFIGDNLADGAAAGEIFAAPPPDVILEATRAVHRGAGVVYLYGNYAGDNMNFDIAAEMAETEGIPIRTVRIWDDVAAAPRDRVEERRGIAGDAFAIKIAGAAAATVGGLDEVHRIACRARDRIRSLGVALRAGSIPETGEPTFELGEDEIEIGMGGHGEPGVERRKLLPADPLVDQMMAALLDDLPFERSDRVTLLLNDLGATTMMELLIVNRRARKILAERGIEVHDTLLGSFLTTQEMAGLSITLMQLDDELTRLYDLPCRSLAWTRA